MNDARAPPLPPLALHPLPTRVRDSLASPWQLPPELRGVQLPMCQEQLGRVCSITHLGLGAADQQPWDQGYVVGSLGPGLCLPKGCSPRNSWTLAVIPPWAQLAERCQLEHPKELRRMLLLAQ